MTVRWRRWRPHTSHIFNVAHENGVGVGPAVTGVPGVSSALPPPPVHQWRVVQVTQEEEGRHMCRIRVVYSIGNTQPQEFTMVTVYTGNPWYEAQPGYVKELTVETKG